MLELKYGDSKVDIDLSKAKSVKVLNENPMDEITDLKSEFIKGVTTNMINSKPLREVISKGDKVTIVISDLTRFWQRQDLICEQLVDYLVEEIGISYDDIVIVVAIGTHRMQTEEELCQLASKKVYDKVKVVNHDCDADDLVCVGKTKIGTEVYVNPLVVGIKQNHIRCLSETEKKTDPRVASRLLDNNPVNEDMNQAGELVDVAFGINIVVNTKSKHSKLFCGDFHDAWIKSCKYVDDCYGVPIEKEADIVIASCGGYPKDINLYQSTKSIFNAARAVKKGGTVIFLAECREGGGAPDFFSWIEPLKRGVLDEELRANFTIGGYIFYALCEAIAKSKMLMLSEIDPNFVKDLNINSYKNIDELLEKVDFEGKDVCVLPYGGSVVPLLQD